LMKWAGNTLPIFIYIRKSTIMANLASLYATIHGHVQGVFFRAFVASKATKLGLTGYVRNMPSGQDVEVQAEGERENLDRLLNLLKIGPPDARVDKVETNWSGYTGKYSRFTIKY
jgi:acylphosphatase